MENNPEEFEKLIRDKYKDIPENSVPNGVWNVISSGLDEEKENQLKRSFRVKTYWAVAATITLLLTCSLVLYKFIWQAHPKDQNDPQVSELKLNESGSPAVPQNNGATLDDRNSSKLTLISDKEKKSTLLPDSSSVTLNHKSTLVFNSRTDIELIGECYFDVHHDPTHPFIIHAGKAVIKVLGTSFNVRQLENGSEVTVTSGRVSLSSVVHPESGKILHAGDVGILSNESVQLVKNTNENILAWKEEKLKFNNMKMTEVAATLENYFDTKITFENKEIGACPFTGTFRKPELEKVLNVISGTLGLTYIKKETGYILTGEGCN